MSTEPDFAEDPEYVAACKTLAAAANRLVALHTKRRLAANETQEMASGFALYDVWREVLHWCLFAGLERLKKGDDPRDVTSALFGMTVTVLRETSASPSRSTS